MQNANNFQSRFFFIIGLVVLVLGVFYFFNSTPPGIPPYKVLTPASYPAGTTVSLYKEVPSNFPKEVILENKTLNYSGTVNNPGGKAQTTVSYISDKSMPEIVDLYVKSLPGVGWSIAEKNVYAKVSIIKAAKEGQNITISIAPIKKGEVMVTFQY